VNGEIIHPKIVNSYAVITRNIARNNRNSQGVGSMVWIKNQAAGEIASAGTPDAPSF
jgi:hypothetical protein